MPAEEDDLADLFLEEPENRFATDPDFRVKLLKWFWLIALLMMLGGYAIMILLIVGRNPFG